MAHKHKQLFSVCLNTMFDLPRQQWSLLNRFKYYKTKLLILKSQDVFTT